MGFFPKEGVDETFSIEYQLRKCKRLSLHKEEKKNDRKNKKELNILYKYFKRRLCLIIRVNVVLNWTVVVDSD